MDWDGVIDDTNEHQLSADSTNTVLLAEQLLAEFIAASIKPVKIFTNGPRTFYDLRPRSPENHGW
jgi:hypothetical protein